MFYELYGPFFPQTYSRVVLILRLMEWNLELFFVFYMLCRLAGLLTVGGGARRSAARDYILRIFLVNGTLMLTFELIAIRVSDCGVCLSKHDMPEGGCSRY